MAQQARAKQAAPKQPQDPYAQRGKALASQVQRLRGWVGSDPSRAAELADALVALTGHRLIGHQYAAAAADAQDAVKRAGQLLTAGGPIGPYTDVVDAVRYITAVVHLAALQAAAGVPEAAARSLASVRELQVELGRLRIEERLEPQTAVLALTTAARAALPDDPSAANAAADAAGARLSEAALTDDAAGYLPLDVERTLSDARWVGGHPVDALGHLHTAVRHHEALVANRLADPGRLSPALLERLAEPLHGLHRDLADRLVASGELDLGLVNRRALAEQLRVLVKRLGDPARIPLALSLADLAEDLRAAGRLDEAMDAADEAATVVDRSDSLGTRLLVATARASVLTAAHRGPAAVEELEGVVSSAEEASPAHALALIVLAEAMRAAGDEESAAGLDAAVTAEAAELGLAGTSRAVLRDRARGVLSRGAGPASWSPLAPEESYAVTTVRSTTVAPTQFDAEQEAAAWLAAERAEAHRQEAARQEAARLEAERREAERREAARMAAERARADRQAAERIAAEETERRRLADEAERAERKRRREERLEAHRLELERLEAERREAERRLAERLAAEALDADPAARERAELERLAAELAELEAAERAGRAADEAEDVGKDVEETSPEKARPEPLREPVEAEAVDVPSEPEVPAELAVAPEPQITAGPAVASEPDVADDLGVSAEPLPGTSDEPRIPVEPAPVRAPEEPEAPADPAANDPAADELAAAQQHWLAARDRGDRRAARAANERLVELLRVRAEADQAYASQLRDALQDLAGARLRGGDLFGSRAASKEAKAIGKSLGD